MLPYIDHIEKIPEPQKVSLQNYYLLPCSEDYAIVSIYSDLFKILSALFDQENLRTNVLTHVRKHWKYYKKNCTVLPKSQKTKPGPMASQYEICIHAVGTFLNIHISVDYLRGTWSTYDIPNMSHKLTVRLCEVHLAYVGYGSFNLLCKQSELKTKARKLLNHKLGITACNITKELQIKLIKLKHMSQWPHKLIVSQETLEKLEHYKGQPPHDMPEVIPTLESFNKKTEVCKGTSIAKKRKDLQVMLTRLEFTLPDHKTISNETLKHSPDHNTDHHKSKIEELYNASTESYTDSDDMEIYSASDSTELYELDETIIGTINLKDLKLDTVNTETSFLHLLFLWKDTSNMLAK